MTSVKATDPDLFEKLMNLSDTKRFDLFDFLGAAPADEAEVSEIVDKIEARIAERLRRQH